MTDLARIRKRADVTPELVQRVTECAAAGCTFEQTSIIVGVEIQSLRRWMASHYNLGRAKAIRNTGAMIYNLANGKMNDKGEWIVRPNVPAACFFLKCQGGWKETTGIVFEDAKPTEDNANRLIELLESRFLRLGEAERKRAKGKPDAPAVPG